MIFVFHTILCILYRLLCVKISSFQNTQTNLYGTNDHATLKVPEITFFLILMVDVNINWCSLPVSAWLCASHCCQLIGRLDKYMKKQGVSNKMASKCMYVCIHYVWIYFLSFIWHYHFVLLEIKRRQQKRSIRRQSGKRTSLRKHP